MNIEKDMVKKIAKLARIRVEEDELDSFAAELSNIISWVEQLDELDTENTDPMTSVSEALATLRPDEVTDGGYVKDVLKNAPASDHGFFTVPKVIE